MKKNVLNIIFNVSFMHKFFACVIAFFILMSSVCFTGIKSVSVLESVKVSADTLLVQFFYISTLPIDIISKLFINTEDVNPLTKNENKNNNKNSKEENSSKASFGYSILPDFSSSQMLKLKSMKTFTLVDKVKKINSIIYFDNYKFLCKNKTLDFSFLMMLLLAILLARRNVGDNNIVLKIKNNRLARLIY